MQNDPPPIDVIDITTKRQRIKSKILEIPNDANYLVERELESFSP